MTTAVLLRSGMKGNFHVPFCRAVGVVTPSLTLMNQVIVVENLAVQNMVRNHNLAKSISDAGWGMFCTMLKYKAEAEGKVYLEVGRFFPSSHLCSNTLLSLPKMDLSVREFDCAQCGNRHDRDINAAINIKNEGLRLLTLGTSVTAKGGNVRPKQYGRKSTAALELGSPYSTRFG